MPVDYKQIREDNIRRYGTDVNEWGPLLLQGLYASPTHFIYELLQNAEDALARRGENWQGDRAVSFTLTSDLLRVSHFGAPFNEADVRGVCSIAKSTKEAGEIGRFGIGFKSVYTFTSRPEIHSGGENFAIENYVHPKATEPVDTKADETLILMPLTKGKAASDEIIGGLEALGTASLLFLRHIDEVCWDDGAGTSGHYLRETKQLNTLARHVTVIGEKNRKSDKDSEWLVFSRPVRNGSDEVGNVEIAFAVVGGKIQKTAMSRLVAYFSTTLDTHLGFLIQGPYRTTSGRDNILSGDEWNRHLIKETATLLPESLCYLRDNNYLNIGALQCLPLDSTKFRGDNIFAPFFDTAKLALKSERLLPRHQSGYTPAATACLGTQALRELFMPSQLAEICEVSGELAWLSGEITPDRTSELHQYLRRELGVADITPEVMARRLSPKFLKKQTCEWVQNLYEFLGDQPALMRILSGLPLVRLENDEYVAASSKVFLPGKMKTNFLTVHPDVCQTERARKFLRAMGLTEPNLVDDIIHHILPKYRQSPVTVSDEDYRADISRILHAAAEDGMARRGQLINALRETEFVKCTNATGGSQWLKPGQAYLPTQRLKCLFDGVDGVWLVDDSYECLRDEGVTKILKECGAAEFIRAVEGSKWVYRGDSYDLYATQLREKSGHPETTYNKDQFVGDYNIDGLESLLKHMPNLAGDARKERAKLLWEELGGLSPRCFTCDFTWTHEGRHTVQCDTAFVRLLQDSAWVPDDTGELFRPDCVLFDSLGWEKNPLLESKIPFKRTADDELAAAAGIEPDVIALLKSKKITAARLRELLGESPSPDSSLAEEQTATSQTQKQTSKGAPREFVSYIKTKPEAEEEAAPENGGPTDKQKLGDAAVKCVCAEESQWQEAPTNNPGFDLYQTGDNGEEIAWCEVKGLRGSWDEHPVTVTHTQFKFAQEKGARFWLYVVEYADTEQARITRIQDPAGRSSTLLFDSGWRNADSESSE